MENTTQNLDNSCSDNDILVTENLDSVISSEIADDSFDQKAYSDFLEAKIVCFEKNISSEKIKDVLSLAENYPSDSLEVSIEKVLSLYPFFKNDFKKSKKITTGIHFSQGSNAKTSFSGVEAAFKKSNPNIKL